MLLYFEMLVISIRIEDKKKIYFNFGNDFLVLLKLIYLYFFLYRGVRNMAFLF